MITKRVGARAAAVAALVALTLSAVSCGVSKTKYADLNKNYDAAMTKNKELQANLDTANKDKEQLASEKAALETTAKQNEETAHLHARESTRRATGNLRSLDDLRGAGRLLR